MFLDPFRFCGPIKPSGEPGNELNLRGKGRRREGGSDGVDDGGWGGDLRHVYQLSNGIKAECVAIKTQVVMVVDKNDSARARTGDLLCVRQMR
jgi:hypothetical protein